MEKILQQKSYKQRECLMLKMNGWTVTVGDTEILPSQSARNIGLYIDPALKMQHQVTNITRTCYFELRKIAKIRKFLSESAAIKLCHAFVTSRLDNLNSLLYKIPDYSLKKLQLVQNCTARLILKLKKHDHITPALVKLHWLQIPERIEYKILLLVFKALSSKGPRYLTEMFVPYKPSRTLRSSSQYLLTERRCEMRYGERALASCGPFLWNKIPIHVRESESVAIFKSRLKTFLFKRSYNTS